MWKTRENNVDNVDKYVDNLIIKALIVDKGVENKNQWRLSTDLELRFKL
jgi:hypothetical protein